MTNGEQRDTEPSETDLLSDQVPENFPRRSLKSQLRKNHSISYDEPRRITIVQKSCSLPKGLNNPIRNSLHGTSPLVTRESRGNYSLSRQGTIETEMCDVESLLFKRTPIDLMKQNASLLTNIICLAITLSLVLVTVVQFSGDRWKELDLKINQLKQEGDLLTEGTTQQSISIDEMQKLLFGDRNGTSLRNLTEIGSGMIETIVQLKQWYLDYEPLLKTLGESNDMVLAKDLYETVFGKGTRPGIVDRLQILEATVADIREKLDKQMSKRNNQIVELTAEVKDLHDLINSSIYERKRLETKTKDENLKMSQKIEALRDVVSKNTETMSKVREKYENMSKILTVTLTNNKSTVEEKVNAP